MKQEVERDKLPHPERVKKLDLRAAIREEHQNTQRAEEREQYENVTAASASSAKRRYLRAATPPDAPGLVSRYRDLSKNRRRRYIPHLGCHDPYLEENGWVYEYCVTM
ncbi:hypothetical protein LTR91_013441 [Friedmanniomyces endolithicus]|uniref:Uncharacterized protein n=1 Tax=Friedmanniomyces endolithicus TaxID=329885 RepID=A0AAN6KDM4_9PEZI|nr:hypothetical protein LTR91_013441 [Friedmanniomyces endolithicus]KAK1085848.1 hypothetical protein LTR33_001863 [Friedmanniomyces endolithicus]